MGRFSGPGARPSGRLIVRPLRDNASLHESLRLTPGFSPVMHSLRAKNRFNGLLPSPRASAISTKQAKPTNRAP
jgi:hypothetical protein